MILIFDLDDTLYPEITYVISGFTAVARWAEKAFGLPADTSVDRMKEVLIGHGRGKVFDLWLAEKGINPTQKLIRQCLAVYRNHLPAISLPASSLECLETFADLPLYIVTDGHKGVQDKKLTALGLRRFVTHAYITHRYGIHNAKPSLHCFDLIRKREKTQWDQLIYVGDNPEKDFINLNKVRAKTIRIRQGMFKDRVASSEKDARLSINTLQELEKLEILK